MTRQQYIKNICNYEKLYLIIVEDENIYLRADFENEEFLRIEMLYAELNPALKFLDAEQEGRKNYCGKIYFIEYESNEIVKKNILTDFLNLADDDAIFLLYENDNLKNFLKIYPNKNIFLLIWKPTE